MHHVTDVQTLHFTMPAHKARKTRWIPIEETPEYVAAVAKDAEEAARKLEADKAARKQARLDEHARWDAEFAVAPRFQAEWRAAPRWRKIEMQYSWMAGKYARRYSL